MHDRQPQFAEVSRLLRQADIIDECSQRLVEELRDHYCDLCDEALGNGCDIERARARALREIGAPADIAAAAASYRELLSVSRRYPVIAGIAGGIVSLPALPVAYCAQRRESIARWGASVGLAAMITAGLLLSLQTMLGVI